MTKINYPSNGLARKFSSLNNSILKDLHNSLNSCNFNVPTNFAYRNYLLSLDDNIRGFIKEFNFLAEQMERNDDKQKLLITELENSVKSLEIPKINPRENIVK